MKYLEGGSTEVAEQGGLMAEAAEAVTRWHRDDWSANLRPSMRVSNEQRRRGGASERQRQSGLGWSSTSELWPIRSPTSELWLIQSPSVGLRLKQRRSEGLSLDLLLAFSGFLLFFNKAFSDFWFRTLGTEALLFSFFFFFWRLRGFVICWACRGLSSITIFFFFRF